MSPLHQIKVSPLHGAWGASGALGQEVVQVTRQDRGVVSTTHYRPRGGGCRGVAIISPGDVGSEQGYRHLGNALSAFGYLAAVMGVPSFSLQ